MVLTDIIKENKEIATIIGVLVLLVSSGGAGYRVLQKHIEAERADAIAEEHKLLEEHKKLLAESNDRIAELEAKNIVLTERIKDNAITMTKLKAKVGLVSPPDNLQELIGWFEDEGITVRVIHHTAK